jgi:hypothetical protein
VADGKVGPCVHCGRAGGMESAYGSPELMTSSAVQSAQAGVRLSTKGRQYRSGKDVYGIINEILDSDPM